MSIRLRWLATIAVVAGALPVTASASAAAPSGALVPAAGPATCVIAGTGPRPASARTLKSTADPQVEATATPSAARNARPVIVPIDDQTLTSNRSIRQVAVVASDRDGGRLTYRVRAAGTEAALISMDLGLRRTTPPRSLADSPHEWFKAEEGGLFFLTRSGDLRKWDRRKGISSGALVARIEPFYFWHPSELQRPELGSLESVIDGTLDLVNVTSPAKNTLGFDEYWMRGADGSSYIITPTGDFYRVKATKGSFGLVRLATLDPLFYGERTLLTRSTPLELPATISGRVVTVGPMGGTVGTFHVEVRVSDGTVTTVERFAVDVTNADAPEMNDIPHQLFGVGERPAPILVEATDAGGDKLDVSGQVAGSEAFFLGRDHRFALSPKPIGWGGGQERWFTGVEGEYFLKPSGDLYLWNGTNRLARGPRIATIEPAFYLYPDLLTSPSRQDLAYVLDQRLGLSPGTRARNSLGLGERWLAGVSGAVFYLTPNGGLYTGGTQRLVAKFSSIYFDEPQRLWAADSDRFSARDNGRSIEMSTKSGYYGSFVLEVEVSDGVHSTTQIVPVEQGFFTTKDNPRVISALSTGNTTMVVSFSERMASTALKPSNYGIVQKNTNPEAGALIVMGARFVDDDRYDVELTTMSQNEVTYTVSVVGMRDLGGRTLAPPSYRQGVLIDPTRADFAGSPPSGADLKDTDGDGLSDNTEQRGWSVRTTTLLGEVIFRDVTSNPLLEDSDGDGLGDAQEASLRIDPRSTDTDDDQLTDDREFNEVYSDPSAQDSDGDGLDDFLEIDFFRTSPNQADSDGDQFSDSVEVMLGNRNARVADLPAPSLEVKGTALRIDVRHTVVDATGTSSSTTKSFASTLTQSTDQTHSRTSGDQHEFELTIAAGYEPGDGGRGDPGFFSASGGYHGTWTSSNTEDSARHTEDVFAESSESQSGSESSTSDQREVVGAGVQATVWLTNSSNRAVRLSHVQLSVLMTDPLDPTVLTPVATLLPESEPDGGFAIGPNGSRGPVIFSNTTIYPNLVDELMSNPRGLIYRYTDFDMVDETGRSFEFINEDVNDRTAGLIINHNGQDKNSDGQADTDSYVERFRVATSAGRVLPGYTHPVLFDENGDEVGITLTDALAAIGLVENNNATTAAQRRVSYATEMVDVNGEMKQRITRIRDTPSLSIPAQAGLGWRIVVDGFARDFASLDDVVLTASNEVLLAFYLDQDGDGLGADLEFMLGTKDNDRDSDDDCLDDRLEYAIGWKMFLVPGGIRTTYSRPNRPDSDFDGLSDTVEAPAGMCDNEDSDDLVDVAVASTSDDQVISCQAAGLPADPDPLKTTSGCDRFNLPRDLVSDPLKADTDGDGLTDVEERDGYSVALYALPTAGNTLVSETPDTWNARTFSGQQSVVQTSRVTLTGVITDPTRVDTDGDTGTDGAEREFGGNPTCNKDLQDFGDPDHDGLVTVLEENGWNITVTGTSSISTLTSPGVPLPEGGVTTVHVTSDPLVADTDGDTLSDGVEYASSFNPTGEPGDDYILHTNPRRKDTDSDGIIDQVERNGFNYPNWQGRQNTFVVLDPADADMDNDGRNDGAEVERANKEQNAWIVRVVGKDPYRVFSDPLSADTDLDQVPDGREFALGSDPGKADTDGDARLDRREIELNLNVLEADVRVTVTLNTLTITYDGDPGENPGDVGFQFGVRLPDPDQPNGVSSILTPIVTEGADIQRPMGVEVSGWSNRVEAAYAAAFSESWSDSAQAHYGIHMSDVTDASRPRNVLPFANLASDCPAITASTPSRSTLTRTTPCRSLTFSMSSTQRFAFEGGLIELDGWCNAACAAGPPPDNNGGVVIDDATYVSIGGYDGAQAYDAADYAAAANSNTTVNSHRAVYHGADLLDRSSPGRAVIRDLVIPFFRINNRVGADNGTDVLEGTLSFYYIVE